ncbi:MAG: hypothetical protein HY726_05215 [Candidatus Rokubacteria bacterium]|nr:hypothetical protein [Candidatus Rokubacteria bacterium]
MPSDVPLLERLAQLPPVAVSQLVELVEAMARPENDPLLRPLVVVDEEGERAINPLLPAVLEHLGRKPDATCYQALLEALTGIWNAAVRAAVVSRLRAQGLPPDDLLLRLQALSPTLGFAAENPQWAREWLADPATQDTLLVQHCVVRLLLAIRGMAEARAAALVASPAEGQSG